VTPSPNPSANPVGDKGEAWQPLSLPHVPLRSRIREASTFVDCAACPVRHGGSRASRFISSLVAAPLHRCARARLRRRSAGCGAALPGLPRGLRRERPLLSQLPHRHTGVAIRIKRVPFPPVRRTPGGAQTPPGRPPNGWSVWLNTARSRTIGIIPPNLWHARSLKFERIVPKPTQSRGRCARCCEGRRSTAWHGVAAPCVPTSRSSASLCAR
jgi:hypothetical protein